MLEEAVLEQYLLNNLVRATDEVRPTQRGRLFKLTTAHRLPATLAPDFIHDLLKRGECLIHGFGMGIGDEPV